MERFEFWSDSFREGVWLCDAFLKRVVFSRIKLDYIHNFIPRYTLSDNNIEMEIVVFGGYRNWKNMPTAVREQIKMGRPDIIVYHPKSEEVILGIEETAAVPTGNQSLQRAERVFHAATTGVPFVYLMGEYGLHKDEGMRRTSIWPAYLAFKLSSQYHVPSLVAYYGSSKFPIDYDVGNGLNFLIRFMYWMLKRKINDSENHEIHNILRDVYSDMAVFIESQADAIGVILPGRGVLNTPEFINFIFRRLTI